MVKFPLTYRDIDKTTRAEGQKITHFECVAYRYDAPQVEVAPIAVTAKAEPKKEVVADFPQQFIGSNADDHVPEEATDVKLYKKYPPEIGRIFLMISC